MFAQRTRGLFDFLAAALCLWAAAYHTPPGALVRGLFSKLLSTQSSARPMLAYYSGGVYETERLDTPTEPFNLPSAELLAGIDSGSALGRGVFVSWAHLSLEQRKPAVALAARYKQDLTGLEDPSRGPNIATAMVGSARAELGGSDEAAVLAVFVGYEVADYAVQRARAENRPLVLEVLAEQLPPSSQDAVGLASQALTLGTAYGLGWPVHPRTRVSSPYGWRTHPTLGRQQLHTGVDLSVPVGTEVRVTAAGVVKRASEDGVNGKVVIIDHGRGVATAYCHNSRLLVVTGQRVTAGEVISESGNTGRSTGPHLHYQLELGHRPTDPFLFKGARTLDAVTWRQPAPAPAPVPAPAPRPGKPSPALINALKLGAVTPDAGVARPDLDGPPSATEF